MKKQKWYSRILPICLAVVLAFCAIPLSAASQEITTPAPDFAAEDNTGVKSNDKFIAKNNYTENVEILEEDISRRGNYEKHFQLDEGSILAVSYAEQVHKEVAPGIFEEIDNIATF